MMMIGLNEQVMGGRLGSDGGRERERETNREKKRKTGGVKERLKSRL